MTHTALAFRGSVLALGTVALTVACTAGSSSAGKRDEGNGGTPPPSSSGQTGSVPGDPQFDPSTLLDSGAPPPNLNEGAVCENVAIGNGEIDQENLVERGAYFLTPSTGKPYQTFTVQKSGYLAGIELAIQRADVGSGDTPGKVRVQIHALPNTELGASELPVMSLPKAKPANQTRRITLSSGPPGPGYFPFGDACVKLEAGVQYYWQAMLVDVPKGVCTDGTCSVGRVGDPCAAETQAQNCDPSIWVSAVTTGSPYDGGGWNNSAGADIVFRTYVQP